ncbi:RHS repeat-associated core domain-containing protein [Micromonospora haikouensis]|uniref:RHS repeat-associated core domain-containing protein n=1 Tax=Micromonospora haikouensis TaxID=686309 RepID=UPI0036BDB925
MSGPFTVTPKRKPVAGAVGSEPTFPPVSVPGSRAAAQVASPVREAGEAAGFVAGRSVERTSARTARSTEFDNPDGTKTLRLFDGTAFVRGEGGQWQPLDNRLSRRADGRFAPAAAAAVTVAPRGDDQQVATVSFGDGASVGFAIEGAAPVAVDVKDETATFAGVRQSADVKFTPMEWGLKEEIVLHSLDAPASWLFPLKVEGLTPSLNSSTGEVVFLDATGRARGAIPPGFMVDSNVHPRRGSGERSNDVQYTLVRQAESWALRVDLDQRWLHDPSRVFPVVVDPTFQDNSETDDTFVSKRDHANRNNSAEGDLLVGTYNGGTERAASYLHFNDLKASRPNRYVLGATLRLWNYWSYSCRARTVNVYAVTKSWSGASTKTWAGPSYDSASRVGTSSFAYGYYDCPNGGWAGFGLPADRVMRWLHGTEAFYGLTVRASETDSYAWKRFASANFSNSTARPYIDLNYSDQGAKYSLPTAAFNPPVTAATAGKITVRVTNWGMTTWTSTNGYRLTYKILNSAGTVVRSGPLYTMPKNVGPHQYADVPIQVDALAVGSYSLRLDMVTPTGASFNSTYGVPFGQSNFTVANGAPTIGDGGIFPLHNGHSDTLTPTLWADYVDPDNTPAGGRQLKFRICKGAPETPSGCQTTAWLSSTTWPVPSGLLKWHETAHWYVTLSDTQLTTSEIGPFVFTPTVAQPEVASHLASAAADADVTGLNPYVGNYSTTITDAAVTVAGPALALPRTYNSQDLRTSGAFGAGWTSPVDQRLSTDTDGSGNVVLTLASGSQVRFGRNADGTYAPPSGMNLTLVATGTPTLWNLRDATGNRRIFTADGRLTSIIDADGRTQNYSYNGGGELTTITDAASGRSLHLTWTSGHVTSVSTDPPASGQSAPTWTYTYTGDTLTQACTPLSAQSCTQYAYTASSHYRSVVTDDNPAAYWPLGEPADAGDAANVVATKPGERDGSYRDVAPGAAGALTGSPDTAVDFGGSTTSAVELPRNLTSTSMGLAVELWFKAAAGENGVLFSVQDTDLDHTPTQWTPILYVGTDGLLRGKIWTTTQGTTTMLSSSRVDDGQWHHVVISGSVDAQNLYLDGTSIGQITGKLIDHRDMAHPSIGNGHTSAGWSATITGNFPFAGLIDEAAYYKHPLGPTQVANHWAARNQTTRLTTVTKPGNVTALQLGYDAPTGRVTNVTDRNGATWDLAPPAVDEGNRVIVLAPDNAEPITYRHDIDHGGRLVSRADTFGERTWTYNARGFVSKYTDANNNSVTYDTDERGNILAQTTCRTSTECNTSYAGYYLNAADPLDRRNDVRIWTADARSASATDTTYRVENTIDTVGRITAVSYPAPSGHTTAVTESFTYSTGTEQAEPSGSGTIPPGLQLTATARNGKITRSYYNTAGDLVRTVDPVGLTTSHTRDDIGRITATTLAPQTGSAYGTTTYTYNPLSQTATVTSPAVTNPITNETHQTRTTYTYNASAQRTSQTTDDITGSDPDRVWTWTYDAAGRPDTAQTPDGSITDQDWDTRGDIVKVTQPGGRVLEHAYDEAHRRIETTALGAGVDPMNPTATSLILDSRAYDPAGRLAFVVDAMGRETAYTYYGDNLPATTSRVRRDANGDITSETRLSKLDYNAAGQVNQQTGLANITSTTVYDKAGYVKEEHFDPNGLNRATTYNRNRDGSIATATRTGTASPGRSEATTYTYDDAGRVLTETVVNTGGSPSTLTTSHQRDARGLVTESTDPAGTTVTYTYDALGNLATSTGETRTVWSGSSSTSAAPTITIGYNAFSEPTQERDPNGAVTRVTYDPSGRPTDVALPPYVTPGGLAIIANYHASYNSQGLLEQAVDSLGRTTSYTYDLHGNLLTRTQPDPDSSGPKTAPVWTSTYDRAGEQLSTTDPAGAVTSATYDDLGRRVTATISDRSTGATLYLTTNLGYDDAGNLTAVTSPLNHTTTATYNAAGEALRVTDPSGRFTQFTYDMAGRNLSAVKGKDTTYVDPVTTQSYDLAGRPTATTDCTSTASGTCGTTLRTSTTSYNGAGQALSSTSAEGRTTEYSYDQAGQLTTIAQRVVSADPASTTTIHLGYDLNRRRTRMVDGNNNSTTYTYTPWGQPASVIEPATTAHPEVGDRTWTTSYDAAGQPVTYLLPGGVTRTLTYDRAGNLIEETGSGAESATAARQLEYDSLGRITKIGGPLGDTTYSWNDRGQLTATAGSAGNATYTYDSEGNLTSRTDSAGTAGFTYNAAGALSTTTDPLTGTTATHTYKNSGQLGQTTYGAGGPTRAYVYDNLARLTADSYKRPNGTTSAATTYTYDRDNQLLTKSTAGVPDSGVSVYTYDGLGRLATWTAPNGDQTAYGYDGASNHTTVTSPTGTRTTTYDERNRATAETGAGGPNRTWTWTPRGTLETQTLGTISDSFTFDAFERLTQVVNTGYAATYAYDALDRLAQRNNTSFAYNDLSNTPVRTPNLFGVDTAIMRDGNGQPLSDKTGTAAARTLIADRIHGDLVAAANAVTGDLTASASYQPYGASSGSIGALPLGYQGGWADPESGQVNAHARWYSTDNARFVSRDTWTLAPQPITQTNRYVYGNANPITGSDPSGHFDPGAAGGLGRALAGISAGLGSAGTVAAACAVACGVAIAAASVGWFGAGMYGGYRLGEYLGSQWRSGRTSGYGYGAVRGSGSTSSAGLPYCYQYPNAPSCRYTTTASNRTGPGRGPGPQAPCSRGCYAPPPTPPCVLASQAAGLSNGQLCRTPWLLDVAPRPKPVGTTRPTSEALLPGGNQIGNSAGNQPEPTVVADEGQESAPNGSGALAGGPAAAQGGLDHSCFAGGWRQGDGSRSAGVWYEDCRDLFDEFGVSPGEGIDLSIPSAENGRSYITYVAVDGDEVRYVGRAQGVGSPENALASRLSKGHDVAKANPSWVFKVVDVQRSLDASKGAEEFFLRAYQQRGARLVNSPESPPLGFSRPERGRKSVRMMDAFFDELQER